MLARVTGMELKRAFWNRMFAVSIVLMVLMEILASALVITNTAFGVDEILDSLFAGTGSDTVLLLLFPLLPYAAAYAKDMEDHALEFYMVRMDTVPFMAVRFTVAAASAFACVVVSFAVFGAVLLCLGHPLSAGVSTGVTAGYQEFLGSHTALYLLCYSADRGLSAAMMAGCAVFMSVLYPNSFFAFTSPACIYLLSERLIFPAEIERAWLTPDSWIEGVYESASGGFATLLCKAGVAALVCLVYGGLSAALAKRRWHYA